MHRPSKSFASSLHCRPKVSPIGLQLILSRAAQVHSLPPKFLISFSRPLSRCPICYPGSPRLVNSPNYVTSPSGNYSSQKFWSKVTSSTRLLTIKNLFARGTLPPPKIQDIFVPFEEKTYHIMRAFFLLSLSTIKAELLLYENLCVRPRQYGEALGL